MTKKTRAKARRVLLTLSLVLVVAFAAVGGTIAWLTDTTETVENVFTPAGVVIDLTETMNAKSSANKTENDIWTAQLIPGKEYVKDPYVHVVRTHTDEEGNTVQGTDVDIYLFVKFEETVDEQVLTYTPKWNDGWTQGQGTGEGKNGVPENVWFRTVAATETDSDGDEDRVSFGLLQGDKVSIANTVTEGTNVGGYMKYTAYAIQKEGSDNAGVAWNKLNVQ